MKVLGVERRDIYVKIEFPAQEVRYLAALLEKAEITYSPEDAFMRDAAEWLHKELEPLLREFVGTFGERDGDS